MAQSMVNFRLDENVKKNMEEACREMGMSMTTAFTIFATKVGRERRIPFEVSCDRPNAETIEAIREVKRMKEDPSLGKPYSDVDLMMEELLADV